MTRVHDEDGHDGDQNEGLINFLKKQVRTKLTVTRIMIKMWW